MRIGVKVNARLGGKLRYFLSKMHIKRASAAIIQL